LFYVVNVYPVFFVEACVTGSFSYSIRKYIGVLKSFWNSGIENTGLGNILHMWRSPFTEMF